MNSTSSTAQQNNNLPQDGNYRFDIAFAEMDGQSMGEKVTVIINGKNIKVIYENDGNLKLTEDDGLVDQGFIMKHKSGQWIIGIMDEDAELDHVGGCTGGPAVIDFENKKYWMC